MVIFGDHVSFRELWRNYRSEVPFFVFVLAMVVAAHWLSRYIPLDTYNYLVTLIQNVATCTACLVGAFLCFRHSGGLRARRLWAWIMLAWAVAEAVFLVQTYITERPVLLLGGESLTAYEMFAGNFLGWLFIVYPTEALRPGWLNLKRAAIQLLPMVLLVLLDYFVPADLRVILALYPALLAFLVCFHIHAYRMWCEDNYSSMDDIGAQWLVRYLAMFLVVGLSYIYMSLTKSPTRSFGQNVLLFFMFVYSTEQILFRKDPWEGVDIEEPNEEAKDSHTSDSQAPLDETNAEYICVLENWMETEKPYLNPELRLMDLRAVLPLNRTYLSQLIHNAYDCSFYQFVNRYRIEEAKRLKLENPERTMEDVALHSGFASRISFSRTFTNETGEAPTEWYRKCNNS